MPITIRERVFKEEPVWIGRDLAKPVFTFSVRRFIIPKGQKILNGSLGAGIKALGFYKASGEVFFVPAAHVRLVWQKIHQRHEGGEEEKSRVVETYRGECSMWLYQNEADNFNNLERGYRVTAQ